MISIVIPVYNVEHYIEDCIWSVLKQTYSQFELILVDDGSTDHSGVICDRYAVQDSRIRVFHQKNAGASVARNKGISCASGEYITFLDSDDYWIDNTYLEKVYNRLQITKPDILCSNFRKDYNGKLGRAYFTVDSMPIQFNDKESINFIYSNELWIACPWNKIIRTELFQRKALDFLEGVTAEDVEWCARLVLEADTFDYLNVIGVGYRQTEGSVSRKMTIKKIKCLKDNVIDVFQISNNVLGEKRKLLFAYLGYQVGVLTLNLATIDDIGLQKNIVNEVCSLLRYLNYSKKRKIKFLRILIRMFGYEGVLLVLRLRGRNVKEGVNE